MRRKLLICLLIFIAGCSSGSVPKGILSPEKMQLIMFDFLKADELANEYAVKDTSRKRNTEAIKLYKQVLALHNTSKDEFFKSYRYYQSHPDKNKVLFDSLFAWVTKKSNYFENDNLKLKKNDSISKPVK